MDSPKGPSAGDPLGQLMKEDVAYRQSEEKEKEAAAPAGSPTLSGGMNIKATAFGVVPSNTYTGPRRDVDELEIEQHKAWQDVLEDRWIAEGDESRHKMDDIGAENTVDVADIGIPTSPGNSNLDRISSMADRHGDGGATSMMLPPRPPLRKAQFEPPSQDPPPPPLNQQQQQPMHEGATDSLSLLQLKRLVSDMPGREPAAYNFIYEDTASFPDELDEWFSYSAAEKEMLGHAKASFDESWLKICKAESSHFTSDVSKPTPWLTAPSNARSQLVEAAIQKLEAADISTRIRGLETLDYVVLGTWGETAGLEIEDMFDLKGYGNPDGNYRSSTLQLKSMIEGASLIYDAIGIPSIYTVFRGACFKILAKSNSDFDFDAIDIVEDHNTILESRELNHSMTLMYVLIEAGRRQVAMENSVKLRDDIAALEPDLLNFLVKILAKIRWKETAMLPMTKLLLLFWKSLLLLFGGTNELNETKKALVNTKDYIQDKHDGHIITASPLDYHLFRQEITSKYPAYNPPQPLLPFELENNSILPPLHTIQNRAPGSHGPLSGIGPSSFSNTGGSIIHQPVHIATPAPSPPPSPAGPGGKAGKKQNYQTNQNFPFLYPPSGTSNTSDGEGSLSAHKNLVGKPWEGSDVPESILEAGELFSKRTRMTRATRQLWDERERFVRFERGWENSTKLKKNLNSTPNDAKEGSHGSQPFKNESAENQALEPGVQRRLNAVDQFYRQSISKLQSLVIVLLKEVLANVTISITQPNFWNGAGLGPGFQDSGVDGGQAKGKQQENGRQPNGIAPNSSNARDDESPTDLDTLDAIRTREINAKAVSGILIVMLKWFKISHILKYEYLTQLLLDSNYLPLVLKLFAHQEIDKVVDSKTDSPSQSFFAYCQLHSEQSSRDLHDSGQDSSDDDAVPPPIRLRRNKSAAQLPSGRPGTSVAARPVPEVDELGQPTGDLPSTPRTSFSWRNFFSSITSLRIMQKITRHKTHRNLLLVHYKSSTILRKLLKVPQPELRLYTLKLFKGQVPYCGRKWRQSNMRVITAVYLHVSPELRDDWLAGGDVDAEVEEALPLEQALRALTHWWHCIEYPEQMGSEESILESEMDFFTRELDSMEWGLDEGAEDMGRDEWEGPFQVEGW